MATVFLAVTATACSSSAAVAPPSTFASTSPWLGTFTAAALPPPVNTLSAVDCVGASRCWAVGSTVGGAGAPNGAAVIATTDGGASWKAQVIPPVAGYLSGIACTDDTHCTAVGQSSQSSTGLAVIITTIDGGTVWAPVAVPAGVDDLTAITCRHDGRCMAVGTAAAGPVALFSTSSGTSWAQAGPLPAGLTGPTAISCTDDQNCWVTGHSVTDLNHVAGSLALSTDGGVSWATVAIPAGIGDLNGISCLIGPATGSGAFPTTTTTTTTAPASSSTATPAAGAPTSSSTASSTTTTAPTTTSTTTPAASPPTTAPPVGVPGIRCTAVGTTAGTLIGSRIGHGLLLSTANGGATWTSASVTTSAASLADVSCPAIGTCIAAGSAVASVTQAGLALVSGADSSPWRDASTVAFPEPLTAVSCVSDSHCVVVGESIIEYLVGG